MKLPLSHLWLPAKKPSKQLIVVLHGLGDSARGFLWLQEALEIDSLNYLLLNAPEPYYSGYRWYDIEDPLSGIVRSRNILSEVFAILSREGYPPEKTSLLRFLARLPDDAGIWRAALRSACRVCRYQWLHHRSRGAAERFESESQSWRLADHARYEG